MKKTGGLLLMLVACGGPNEETLIDELRVVAMVAEPPEVAPGESVQISVLTSVPEETETEQMTWSCLPMGEACLEGQGGSLENWVHQGELDAVGATTYSIDLPVELGAFLQEEEELRVPLWTLSCAPGVCPLFAMAKDSPDAAATGWAGLMSALADPISELALLPKEGVSLAVRTLVVSDRAPESRNQNPVLVPESLDAVSVSLEQSVELQFSLEDEGENLQAFGYTTIGGFGTAGKEVDAGVFDLTLFGPIETSEATEGRLFVVVNDGQGGTATWTQPFSVDSP